MTIKAIDSELCTGCGICVNCCQMDVIRMDKESKKPVIKYLEDCSCCYYCGIECPVDAVIFSPEKYEPIAVSWC